MATAAMPPAKRGPHSSTRSFVLAIVAIVAVAAVVIAGFAFLGSAGLTGKAVVAFVGQYEGTWVDQQTGDKAVIDTSGGVARISIIDGSDGELATVTVDGDGISVAGIDSGAWTGTLDGGNISANINGAQLSLTKDTFVVKDPSSGESRTFVRHE
jgi:hypothetical protein